jgi:hypothetical protein
MNTLFSMFKNCLKQRGQLAASSMLILLLSAIASPSMAAYCSLRDPITAIQTLYPDSTHYESVVKPITLATRQQISERLPFTIHYNEIGKHTLYLVLNNDQRSGIVQARSELSSWGLIEIAWAINADLSIHDLVFQRCRSPKCNNSLRSQVRTALQGKSFEDILPLLTADGLDFTLEGKALFPDHQPLHLTIIHSALKTLAITGISWSDILLDLQKRNQSHLVEP